MLSVLRERALPQKSELKPTAPKARNMERIKLGSTESAKYFAFKPNYYALSELRNGARVDQGRRVPLPLHACRWLTYSAPLALFGSHQTFEAKPPEPTS